MPADRDGEPDPAGSSWSPPTGSRPTTHILDTPIPDKGAVLTQLSLWWFERLADLVPNHIVSTEVPDAVAGRACSCGDWRCSPVECVARAYLTGGGLQEYAATGTISGVALPPGHSATAPAPLSRSSPSTKAPQGEHDEPIPYAVVRSPRGPPGPLRRELTVAILRRGNGSPRA